MACAVASLLRPEDADAAGVPPASASPTHTDAPAAGNAPQPAASSASSPAAAHTHASICPCDTTSTRPAAAASGTAVDDCPAVTAVSDKTLAGTVNLTDRGTHTVDSRNDGHHLLAGDDALHRDTNADSPSSSEYVLASKSQSSVSTDKSYTLVSKCDVPSAADQQATSNSGAAEGFEPRCGNTTASDEPLNGPRTDTFLLSAKDNQSPSASVPQNDSDGAHSGEVCVPKRS